MPVCPLSEDCPSFQERIEGLGCQHYGNRGGAEWCNHYNMPITELKQQPVKVGEQVVVEVDDIHESGAGVGHTEDGFVVFVDGILPPARARVKITHVKSNHARADEVERLELEDEAEEAGDDGEDEAEGTAEEEDDRGPRRPQLGSRDNFWGS